MEQQRMEQMPCAALQPGTATVGAATGACKKAIQRCVYFEGLRLHPTLDLVAQLPCAALQPSA
eukprot:2886494-Lingulodinium_polyedra.AAC.1